MSLASETDSSSSYEPPWAEMRAEGLEREGLKKKAQKMLTVQIQEANWKPLKQNPG